MPKTKTITFLDPELPAAVGFGTTPAERPSRGRPRKHLLKLGDVAGYLNVSRTTFYELLKQGLPCYRVGAFRRFDLDAVMRWVEEQGKAAAR